MPRKDPRVDAYIAKAAPFAKPILRHLRKLVHEACPKVEETMKWSSPFFEHEGALANMAAFKAHCVFGLWKGVLLLDRFPELAEKPDEAMGHFGRITSLDDLPSDKRLLAMVRAAAKLNEQGVKLPIRTKVKAPRSRRIAASVEQLSRGKERDGK